ncbi:YdeI/OmpD-associated family protein [Candidatus Nomurabacteria bacterium]|uniref:YdeI/OmpD-associated family protein n=1 Tax=Candidatus Dojkabacteria bacterium TaxID=2099670 RepID=A0A955I2D7_9BACT|nr:YdeI/OmpD-associated family protein [Candidatus Dojkabacteria bacterium]MCB9789789.1 YdeI/OmpD-associated family protein [Candidatus Nomurabacteria bacterium]MCB9803587.1 YdeI/OmpD-associated family protein [Candidatus Nomurabacteria bacterium]
MIGIKVSTGVVHKVPEDLKKKLLSDQDILTRWNSLTPLARNEWICWVTIVKRPETRKSHIVRLGEDISKGKRRPCCWSGCPHRQRSKSGRN